MTRWLRSAAVALVLLSPVAALAQGALLQGGAVTQGHVPAYANSGSSGAQAIVIDSGPASGGAQGSGLSELNVTARGTGTAPFVAQGTGPLGTNICFNDGPTNATAGYHYLCFSANAQGGGLISYGAGGVASSLPLSFNVNGVAYQFPFTTTGVVGPSTSVVNDAACWNNTSGTLLKDCGAFVTVGGNNTWTGTNNFTGPFQINSVAQTFPASGSIVGTSDVQALTNKSINASEVNSGTLAAAQMPALSGAVTSSAGSTSTTLSAGVVGNSNFAAMTQNAVKGAATSTAVADLGMPSCSSAGNALQWTTNTGFGCGSFTNQSAGWGLTGSSTFSVSTSAPPFSFDAPINMGLTASVGASALTINLTTQGGATPSSTNPVLIPFRSTTLATGTPTWTAVTSALSIVVPSAASLGTSNSTPFRIWIFATYNSGVPELGVAVCSTASRVFPCAGWENSRVTTTTIDGFATAAGTLYATSGVSNDAVRIIGFADYASGLATAGAYASVPTTLQVFGPGIKKPGEQVQIVRLQTGTVATGTTAFTVNNTIPTNTAGDQYMSQAITPSATPNLLRVQTQGMFAASASVHIAMALFYSGSANALAAALNVTVAGGDELLINLRHMMQAGSTSALTFTVREGCNGGCTSTFNGVGGTTQEFGGVANSYIEIEEIMGALDSANDNDEPLHLVG